MRILLTNDDGVQAPGLVALQRHLCGGHCVDVVAPDRERSAVSHAITLLTPLRVHRVTNGAGEGFAVNGTPADCVKLALWELLAQKPDVVISGINPGPNVGRNLNYSGTVSAAKEAALLSLPAIAVSVSRADAGQFCAAAKFIEALAQRVLQYGLPPGVFLNVNLPDVEPGQIRGVRICRQGEARLEETFHKRTDPRNQVYYWQGSVTRLLGESSEEDGVALKENYIAVTPVRCDMTDYGFFSKLESWDLDLT